LREVVFFDGDCLFCQARVRWLRARDRDQQLSFAPLQGDVAARVLAGTGLLGRSTKIGRPDEIELSTMVFVIGVDSLLPEIFVKSRAVAAVAARLPFPWRLGGLVALVPRFVADAGYDWVARRRHRWARADACEMTDAGAVIEAGPGGTGAPHAPLADSPRVA
jgi:predicted DCC family thiol-disulfide oxidoreductase YuxK